VAAEKEMAGRPVVLLAAPTMKALLNLINEYDFSRVLQAVEEQASSMPKDVGEKKQGQNKSGAFQIKWGWDGKNSLDRICSIDIIPPFKYFKNLRTF
jgi:hypothetical protein